MNTMIIPMASIQHYESNITPLATTTNYNNFFIQNGYDYDDDEILNFPAPNPDSLHLLSPQYQQQQKQQNASISPSVSTPSINSNNLNNLNNEDILFDVFDIVNFEVNECKLRKSRNNNNNNENEYELIDGDIITSSMIINEKNDEIVSKIMIIIFTLIIHRYIFLIIIICKIINIDTLYAIKCINNNYNYSFLLFVENLNFNNFNIKENILYLYEYNINILVLIISDFINRNEKLSGNPNLNKNNFKNNIYWLNIKNNIKNNMIKKIIKIINSHLFIKNILKTFNFNFKQKYEYIKNKKLLFNLNKNKYQKISIDSIIELYKILKIKKKIIKIKKQQKYYSPIPLATNNNSNNLIIKKEGYNHDDDDDDDINFPGPQIYDQQNNKLIHSMNLIPPNNKNVTYINFNNFTKYTPSTHILKQSLNNYQQLKSQSMNRNDK